MQKLIKLSAVSMLAVMTASNANAAGYTCEELIEYTSCNTGYALLDGDCVCDGGYYTNGDKCTVCPIGTYSSVNASECTTCPTTGLVDPDNKAIVATTASTGSKNISACIIPTNVTIKGETGLYHFKSSCAYNLDDGPINGLIYPALEDTVCAEGYELDYDDYRASGSEYTCFWTPKTEAECVDAGGDAPEGEYITEWDGKECKCVADGGWEFDEYIGVYCYHP